MENITAINGANNMDHVFTMVVHGGHHAEVCRMRGNEPMADVDHNFALLSASARKRNASIVWTRGDFNGLNMSNAVKVSA